MTERPEYRGSGERVAGQAEPAQASELPARRYRWAEVRAGPERAGGRSRYYGRRLRSGGGRGGGIGAGGWSSTNAAWMPRHRF